MSDDNFQLKPMKHSAHTATPARRRQQQLHGTPWPRDRMVDGDPRTQQTIIRHGQPTRYWREYCSLTADRDTSTDTSPTNGRSRSKYTCMGSHTTILKWEPTLNNIHGRRYYKIWRGSRLNLRGGGRGWIINLNVRIQII